ncbi:hypothetical protein ACLESO_42135 [Pyxidicoccus sp. 3LG]
MTEKQQQGTRGGKARSRRTAPRVAKGTAAEDRGSLALRRTTSEYRAAAEEQAARVREEIEAALVIARSTREDIEQRIADQLHAPPVSRKAPARKKSAARKRTH